MSDPHLGFILASYAVTGIVLAGLIAWVLVDGRRQSRAIAALDRRARRQRDRERA